MATILQQLDHQLEKVVSNWSIVTTVLAVVLVTYLISPLFFSTEPDTHPFLLSRQSNASRVRQPGETAVYRSQDTPPGYPLRSGLNVKDPGAPKWSGGRDGDLRDVWRRAATGPPGQDGNPTGEVGKLYTILGKEDVLESTFQKLSAELNAVGKHLKAHGASWVAIYLSNSPELLVSLFATLFYGMTPILISQEQSLERLASILKKTNADCLVVGAGSVPLKDLLKYYNGLKEVIWVVPKSSRHLDWNETHEKQGGKTEVTAWHELVDGEGSFASSELPPNDSVPKVANVTLVSPPSDLPNDVEIIEFTQKNLVAATSAQLAALPYAHRLSAKDTLLPLEPLTSSHPLTVTLAALFSNASIALTSVTGPGAKYATVFNGSPTVNPTVVVVNPIPLYGYAAANKRGSGLMHMWKQYQHNRLLSSMESTGAFPSRASLSLSGGHDSIRLIYTTSVMLPRELADLRIYTGARIVAALTNPRVAGAIAQTHMLDYRTSTETNSKGEEVGHFGPPLSCLEIKLVATEGHNIADDQEDGRSPEGTLVVKGPAVAAATATGAEDSAETDHAEIRHATTVYRMTDAGTLSW